MSKWTPHRKGGVKVGAQNSMITDRCLRYLNPSITKFVQKIVVTKASVNLRENKVVTQLPVIPGES